MKNMKCIIGIVERGKADMIVKAAKKAGASGATIFFARGTGETEAKRFFNINVESAKEVIIILADTNEKDKIVEAMTDAGKINDAGTGIIFTLNIEDLIGLSHRENIKK